jgi:hypothetical protein
LAWKFFKKNLNFYLTARINSATTFAMDKNKIFKTGKALLFITSGLLLSDACFAAAPARPPVDYFHLAADQVNPLPVPVAAPARSRAARVNWTTGEDNQLTQLHEELGNKWAAIARQMNTGKTGNQCQIRWMEHLDLTIKKGSWTKAEDKILKDGVEAGFSWTDIARQMNTGRTDRQCRVHYKLHLDPNINKGGWTAEEDARLIQLATTHGEGNWTAVARELGTGRTDQQCRYRYQHLKNQAQQPQAQADQADLPLVPVAAPVRARAARVFWTEEEDQILIDGVENRLGWTAIARRMNTGRIGDNCRNRWRVLENRAPQPPAQANQTQANPPQHDSVSYFRLAADQADQANQAPANPPPQPAPALPLFELPSLDPGDELKIHHPNNDDFGDSFGSSFGSSFGDGNDSWSFGFPL